ncbi:hypothetical protein ACL6C3_24335 [Capilliphycus salinus ALCB114379]
MSNVGVIKLPKAIAGFPMFAECGEKYYRVLSTIAIYHKSEK